MRKHSIFATDLDGTLLQSDGTFNKLDLYTLADLQQSRCSIVLATGRSPFSFANCVKDKKIPIDWYVLSSGSVILDSKENLIYSSFLSKKETALIYNCFIDLGIESVSIQGEYPNAHFFHWKINANCADFRRRRYLYKDYSLEFSSAQMRSTEVIGYVDPKIAGATIQKLKKLTKNTFSIIKATSPLDHKTIWIEVFPKNVNKATACERIRAICDIQQKHTAAIGNDWNDLEMLNWANKSYITDTAPTQLCKQFYIVPSNDNNAVHHAATNWRKNINENI